jgi:arylesterase/paraoxonase
MLNFVKDIRHKNLKTPNSVAATGPLSVMPNLDAFGCVEANRFRSFFITNDHYYYSGMRRTLEDKYGPWTWATHVAYCDASGPKTNCRQVSGTHQYANGILLVDNKTLLVNDMHEGSTNVYDIDLNTKELVLERKIVSQVVLLLWVTKDAKQVISAPRCFS